MPLELARHTWLWHRCDTTVSCVKVAQVTSVQTLRGCGKGLWTGDPLCQNGGKRIGTKIINARLILKNKLVCKSGSYMCAETPAWSFQVRFVVSYVVCKHQAVGDTKVVVWNSVPLEKLLQIGRVMVRHVNWRTSKTRNSLASFFCLRNIRVVRSQGADISSANNADLSVTKGS